MSACPSCGASLRPDSPWCTLCYADLRPAPTPDPFPPATAPEAALLMVPPTAAYGAPAADPLTQPLVDFLPRDLPADPLPLGTPAAEPTWPCSECALPNPLSAPSCTACGAGFLAAVAQTGRPSLVLPVLGDVARLSRGQRMAAAFGVVAVLMVPLALATLLMTGRPAKNNTTVVVETPSVTATP